MKAEIKTIDNKKSGEVSLNKNIFGIKPREDIVNRVVKWQLAKRRVGSHKVKGRSDVIKSGSKIFRQKGTGRARASNGAVSQFRGGGVVHGPVLRSHSHNLPKKVRNLGLKSVLSSKFANGNLVIIDDLKSSPKTSDLKKSLKKLGITNAIFVGGEKIEKNFNLAASNIPLIDVLPQQGANVYDFLKREILIISKDALKYFEKRLG